MPSERSRSCVQCITSTSDLRLLPCLHFCCMKCLKQTHSNASSSRPLGSATESIAPVFTCVRCGHKMLLSSAAMERLKSQTFLSSQDRQTRDTEGETLCSDCRKVLIGAEGEGCLAVDQSQFCGTCDLPLCISCADQHGTHAVCSLREIIGGRLRYVDTLSTQMRNTRTAHVNRLSQLAAASVHLDSSRTHLVQAINARTEELCRLVQLRRDALMKELDKESLSARERFSESSGYVRSMIKNIDDALDFVDEFFSQGDNSRHDSFSSSSSLSRRAVLNIYGDLSTHFNRLANHGKPRGSGEVTSLRLEISDADRGTSEGVTGVDRFFGGLVRGTVTFGGTERLATYSVDLPWPSSFVTTRSKDFVIAGKTGAFASNGKMLFFDRQANLISSFDFPPNSLPISVVATHNGRVLVSDTLGHVTKFSSCGRLLDTFKERFTLMVTSTHGTGMKSSSSGHMAMSPDGNVWITSRGGVVRKMSAVDGQFLESVRIDSDRLESEPSTGWYRGMEDSRKAVTGMDSREFKSAHDCGGDPDVQETSHSKYAPQVMVDHKLRADSDGGTCVPSVDTASSNGCLLNQASDGLQGICHLNKSYNVLHTSCDYANVSANVLDVHAIAVDCNDNIIVSVPSSKKVYAFSTSSQRLLFVYPPSFTKNAEQDLEKQDVKKQDGRSAVEPKMLELVASSCTEKCEKEKHLEIIRSDENCEGLVLPNGQIYDDVVSNRSRDLNKADDVLGNAHISGEVESMKHEKNENNNPCLVVRQDQQVNDVSTFQVSCDRKKFENNEILQGIENSESIKTVNSETGASVMASNIADIESATSFAVDIKCPSAVCCDPFNNVLIADFTSDCIHLVSPTGQFLGHLVTREDGISCPTFVALDADGSRLYVGQYGGEIVVFRYLSCVKNA